MTHLDINQHRVELRVLQMRAPTCWSATSYFSRTLEWDDASGDAIWVPNNPQECDSLCVNWAQGHEDLVAEINERPPWQDV